MNEEQIEAELYDKYKDKIELDAFLTLMDALRENPDLGKNS